MNIAVVTFLAAAVSSAAEWTPTAWPVLKTYDAGHLREISLPLGGIGTGSVGLGGRGELRDWQIMNRPSRGYCGTGGRRTAPFFAVSVKLPDGRRATRMAAGPLVPDEYLAMEGEPVPNHGLPRFSEASFEAAFPFGTVRLSDPKLPLALRVRGFSPFIPGDVADSSLPYAALVYEVENRADAPIEVSLCGVMRNFVGADGSKWRTDWKGSRRYEGALSNRNEYVDAGFVRGIRFLPGAGLATNAPAWGEMALATDVPREAVTYRTSSFKPEWNSDILDFWDDFGADGEVEARPPVPGENDPMAALCVKKTVPAQGRATFAFHLAWRFPNRLDWGGTFVVGNHYAGVFPDAPAVLARVVPRLPELERRTKAFVDSVLRADAPDVLKEAALFNLAVYKSPTVFRIPSGHFMAWEGVMDERGSCRGSCTHVWNYEEATARLFPELARTMRDVEFNYALAEGGFMAFRAELPLETAAKNHPAADGQMGCIVKAYREWRISGDDAWLAAIWPKVRAALAAAWRRDGTWNWDPDEDGVMDGRQHNTMDVDYYGPNPQMEFWYLAALQAGERMAAARGDEAFAAKCRAIRAKGRAWTEKNLFNGEYFRQIVPAVCTAAYQIGGGCLVDQLVGDALARLAGLDPVLDPALARRTMESVWKYNHVDDMAESFRHQRSYAMAGEGGLLMASWPKGGRERFPFPYFSEVMTGFEYTAATEMVFTGLREEALRVVRDVRARHDGLKRNPFSEPECGHYYGRSLASWGTFRAWTE